MNWPEFFEPLALTSIPSAAAMKFDLSEDHFRKLLLEGVDNVAAAAAGEISASTPVSGNVSVVDTAGGTSIVAALAGGQIIEIFNSGSVNVTLRISGDPAVGTGFILTPGALYTTPRPIKTAIKGITGTGTSAVVHYTRFP